MIRHDAEWLEKLGEEGERRAQRLHASTVVVDCCSIIPFDPTYHQKVRKGGVTAISHTVVKHLNDLSGAVRDIGACLRWIRENSEELLLVTSLGEINLAKSSGRVGIIFGPQDPNFLGDNLDLLDAFHELGVRILQLTYQRQNLVGCGCAELHDGGLSRFGRDLVKRMNELGILIDLSHCGEKTAEDAIELSQRPVVFTHAHPFSLSPHVRAKRDGTLRKLAEKGGVVGLTALSLFLAESQDQDRRPDLNDFIRHVDYLSELLGIDHIGLGLDFDDASSRDQWLAANKRNTEFESRWSFEERRIEYLSGPDEVPNVTRALVAHGYSDDDIRKILGGNFLRVFDNVWGG